VTHNLSDIQQTADAAIEGAMVGPKPTQKELEHAMVNAGCTDITTRGGDMWEGTDDAPQTFCERKQEDIRISVSYSDIFAESKGSGFTFAVWDPKAQYAVHDDGLNEFRELKYRDFDQSLVTPLDE